MGTLLFVSVRLHWDAQRKCSLNWEIGRALKWKETHLFCSLCLQHIYPSKLAGMRIQALKKERGKKKAQEFISLCSIQGWVPANKAKGICCVREQSSGTHRQGAEEAQQVTPRCVMWVHPSHISCLLGGTQTNPHEREKGVGLPGSALKIRWQQPSGAFILVQACGKILPVSTFLKSVSDFRDFLVMPHYSIRKDTKNDDDEILCICWAWFSWIYSR